jgi:hypothetical protein
MNDEAGRARARWREERRATCMIEGKGLLGIVFVYHREVLMG